MSKFNTKSESTRVENLAGGKAFSMKPEMELIHAVLTTFLEDKYYEAGSDRLDRIRGLVASVDPVFALKLAVVARKEFHMRSVSHVLLGEVSKTYSGKDDIVKRAIVEAAIRPDDLTELVSYVGTPLTKQVKRGVRNAILKFDRYQLSKYQAKGKGVSLVDLFNLTHPKVQHANEEQKKAWIDLVAGNLKLQGAWESDVSATQGDVDKKKEVWSDLVKSGKIGYMALLRNLNNLLKNSVDEETLTAAASRLADPVEVAKSKQLPFRFYTAYENVKGNRMLSGAISDALDASIGNAPSFGGRTLVAVDSSGSMGGRPVEIAAIFGAAIAKNSDADIIMYADHVEEVSYSPRTPVIDLVQTMHAKCRYGGTHTSLVFDYAKNNGPYDRIVILSDNESWMESWSGTDTNANYNKYIKETGQNPYIYAIDIQGYGSHDVVGGKVFHLTGWSDKMLDFMNRIEGGEKLIDYIKNYEL